MGAISARIEADSASTEKAQAPILDQAEGMEVEQVHAKERVQAVPGGEDTAPRGKQLPAVESSASPAPPTASGDAERVVVASVPESDEDNGENAALGVVRKRGRPKAGEVREKPAKRRKRKRRKPLSIEEDRELLRVVAQLKPHRAPHGMTSATWRQAARLFQQAMGSEMTELLCKSRFGSLLVKHAEGKLADPEADELVREILEDRRRHQEEREGRTKAEPVAWPSEENRGVVESELAESTSCLYPSVARKLQLGVREKHVAGKKSPLGKAVATGDVPSLEAMETIRNASTSRRSFVQETLTAVADRLVEMESLWLKNAEQQRAFEEKKLAIQHKTSAIKTESVRVEEAKELKASVSELQKALQSSNETQAMLKHQVEMLKAARTRSETDHAAIVAQLSTVVILISSIKNENFALKQQLTQVSGTLCAERKEKLALEKRVTALATQIQGAVERQKPLDGVAARLERLEEDFELYIRQQAAERERFSETFDATQQQNSKQFKAVEAKVEEANRRRVELEESIKRHREEALTKDDKWKKDSNRKMVAIAEALEDAQRGLKRLQGDKTSSSQAASSDESIRTEMNALRLELQHEREDRRRQHDALLRDLREALAD